MAKIRILPKIVSSKIAAGEVVQRPASVVKELIENSIDAESSKITIEINEGGRSLIRVLDDGIGMSKEDALLSLERYATSKIKNDMDLFSIESLGFRGEAIPSISSVSKFSIITREYHDDISTKINVEGGKVKNVSKCGSPYGSIMTVRDLFFNVPVRKKFLKSINTEIYRIINVVVAIAISRPKIKFKLLHNHRIIKNFLDFNNSIDRINDILGSNLTKHLLPVEFKNNGIFIKGWLGNQELSRSSSKDIYFFINGRYIKNQAMIHSLTSAYKEKIAKGQYPVAFIFIELPYDQIDINVHPTKREVRILNQNEIYDSLNLLINETIQRNNYLRQSKIHSDLFINDIDIKSKDEEKENLKYYKTKDTSFSDEHKKYIERDFFSNLTVIGQYCKTYIICSLRKDLILIDQHSAHELVLLEQLKLNNNSDKNIISQNLTVTELIETNFDEAKILRKLIPNLEKYGFKIKPFGGTTFIIKAIPILIKSSEIYILIKKLIKQAAKIVIDEKNIQSIMYKCLITIACCSAIKVKQSLTNQEIRNLMHQLDIYKNSSYCPHGKPVWIKISFSDLKKKFN